jgi:hypothetical protein
METPRKPHAIRNVLVFILVLGLVALLNLLIHEFGHCITMDSVGGGCEGVYVLPDPGFKIWHLDGFGDPYPNQWENYIGVTRYAKSPPIEWASGLVKLMGSGTVAIISLLALVGLYVFRPKSWIRFPLLAQSMMFLDLLFYTILPRWFGLRHFFFIGGDSAEPLEGALRMGITESIFIVIVLLYSLAMIAGLVNYLRQDMKPQRNA